MKIKRLFFKYLSFLKPFYGILMFIGLTLLIHYAYRFWANQLHFNPIRGFVQTLRLSLATVAFNHTTAILELMGYEFSVAGKTFTFSTGNWLSINASCSGFKQLLQALFLFLLFPGQMKHKIWFIPMAMLLMHVANIIRLVGVSLTLYYLPDYWEFSHDYVFRFVFYLILFLLWVWWEEKYRKN